MDKEKDTQSERESGAEQKENQRKMSLTLLSWEELRAHYLERKTINLFSLKIFKKPKKQIRRRPNRGEKSSEVLKSRKCFYEKSVH